MPNSQKIQFYFSEPSTHEPVNALATPPQGPTLYVGFTGLNSDQQEMLATVLPPRFDIGQDSYHTHVTPAQLEAVQGMLEALQGAGAVIGYRHEEFSSPADVRLLVNAMKSKMDSEISRLSVPANNVEGQKTYVESLNSYTVRR